MDLTISLEDVKMEKILDIQNIKANMENNLFPILNM